MKRDGTRGERFATAKRDQTRRGEPRRGAADTRASSEWEVRYGEILSYDVDTRPLNLILSVYRVSSSEAVAALVIWPAASWESDGKKPRIECAKLLPRADDGEATRSFLQQRSCRTVQGFWHRQFAARATSRTSDPKVRAC